MRAAPILAPLVVVLGAAGACAPAAPSSPPPIYDVLVCRQNIDCPQGAICAKDDEADDLGRCEQICPDPDDDCCGRRTDCGWSSLCDPLHPEEDCAAGESCFYVDGLPTCGEPPVATACQLEPASFVLPAGAPFVARVLGTDDAARPVGYAVFDVAVDGVDVADGVVACAGPDRCRGVVRATASRGDATCTAPIVVLPASDPAAHHVVVRDAVTGVAIVGAQVVVTTAGGDVALATDADGVASDGAQTGGGDDADGGDASGDPPRSIVVTAPGYAPTTIASPLPGAVVVDLPPLGRALVAGGASFDAVSTQGDIKLALVGAATPRAVVDPTPAALLGDSVLVSIDLEGVTDGPELHRVPRGLVMALGNDAIKARWEAPALPGDGLLWAVGGKVRLAEIGPIISNVDAAVDADAGVDHGSIMAATLPFFARFDHDVVPLVVDGDATVDVALDTLLSQSASIDVPVMPFDLVFAVIGADVPARGFVPLGVTAGLDDPDDEDGVDQTDGLVDWKPTNGNPNPPPSGRVVLDYAPPHDGLEGAPLVVVLASSPATRAFDADAPVSVVVAAYGLDGVGVLAAFPATPVVAYDGAALTVAAPVDADVVVLDADGARVVLDPGATSIAVAASTRLAVTAYDLGDAPDCPTTFAAVATTGTRAIGPCARAWSRVVCRADGAWTCDAPPP